MKIQSLLEKIWKKIILIQCLIKNPSPELLETISLSKKFLESSKETANIVALLADLNLIEQ